MTEIRLFAFYGSLRIGMANYRLYSSYLQYLETVRLPGYKLYALSDYPYAVRATASDIIVAELFKIENEVVRRDIHQMELEAGYVFDQIAVCGGQAGIYIFSRPCNESFVSSGDWVSFVRENSDR